MYLNFGHINRNRWNDQFYAWNAYSTLNTLIYPVAFFFDNVRINLQQGREPIYKESPMEKKSG